MRSTQAELIEGGARLVRARLGGEFPATALILGSGLGAFADRLEKPEALSYGEIPGFSGATVAGHTGRLVLGAAAGTRVAVLQGRLHAYEGHSREAIAAPIRILRRLGVERLILTNAAGSLTREMPAGSLMIIEDHINLAGFNPLVGPNDETVGPRFPDMSAAYDSALRARLRVAAQDAGVAVTAGVYVYVMGPSFETPAEIRMMATMGGRAVGMSTVPECLIANHCGMKVAGLSVITNLGSGLADHPLSHEETIAAAAAARERVEKLLLRFLARSEC
jgi:inosine/guanosine/xanthosine phosphorylase family protein